LRSILDFIHAAGFSGVEIFQHPRYLRKQFRKPAEIHEALGENELQLIGLCSGSLSERAEFCSEYNLKPEYLYVDSWDQKTLDTEILPIIERGFRIAFHPHAYKHAQNARRDEIDTAIEQIKKIKGFHILVDPAHLTVMNRDPNKFLSAVSDLKEPDGTPKLLAVHLKDWGGWYGRSFQRYAQGFCSLGTGEVKLEDFFASLLRQETPIWAILEQDHTTAAPETCISQSIEWIRKQLANVNLASPRLTPLLPNHTSVTSAIPMPVDLSPSGERVLNCILRSQESLEVFAEFVADLFQEWFKVPLVSLWEHTPAVRGGRMTILGASPRGVPVGPMNASNSLAGYVVESKETWFQNEILHVDGRKFSRPEVAAEYKLKSLISVPILNSHNPNDVQATLNIYFDREDIEYFIPASEELHFEKQQPMSPRLFMDRILTQAAEYIAIALERILADRVLKAASEVRTLSGKSQTRADFLRGVLEIACKGIQAEAATFFIEDAKKQLREAACTTLLVWRMKYKYYGLGEGNVGKCWENDMELVDDLPPSTLMSLWDSVDLVVEFMCQSEMKTVVLGCCVAETNDRIPSTGLLRRRT
jgi:sugar phosphate isomerase/epimerase